MKSESPADAGLLKLTKHIRLSTKITAKCFSLSAHTTGILFLPFFDKSITVVYTDVDSTWVSLKNTKTSEETKISYEGCENLLIWTEPFSDFVCIEPWCGMADFGKTHDDISTKLGIHFLEESETFEINRIIAY